MGLFERVMGIPRVYENFQAAIWRSGERGWLADSVIRATSGVRILGIGCGPAEVLSHLGDVKYVGIDHNLDYIAVARAQFGSYAEFHCWDVTDNRIMSLGKFDIVLLLGVLHHITDSEIQTMLHHVAATLKPDGRVITFDCAIDPEQHPIARLLARLDRGRYARATTRYLELISPHFTPIDVIVRHDQLRVPYTTATIVARPRNRGSAHLSSS